MLVSGFGSVTGLVYSMQFSMALAGPRAAIEALCWLHSPVWTCLVQQPQGLTRGLVRKLAGRKCTSASSSLVLWKNTSVGHRNGVSRSLLAMRQSARTLAYQSWSHQHCHSGITIVRLSTLQ